VTEIVLGSLVEWEGKLGFVEAIEADGDGAQGTVSFDDGERMIFKLDAGRIDRVVLEPGAQVCRHDGEVGVVLESSSAGDYPMWKVAFASGITTVVEMALRPAVLDDPIERMRSGQLGRAEEFNMRAVAAEYWLAHRFSPLVSLSQARVNLMPHQVFVAHRVVSEYPHRFMLCDEVGLGKTIEAAMIIKELRARGQAQRVLILVPSGLQRQWQFELKTKFNETFAIYNSATIAHLKNTGAKNPWTEHSSIITSHTWSSWDEARREEIASVPWDMVIVDEAHHARAQRHGSSTSFTNLYRLVRDLVAPPEASRRAVLFLTASPMQLASYELYSMCEMLDPVLFASEEDFVEHLESRAALSRSAGRLEADGLPAPGTDEYEDLLEVVGDHLELTAETAADLLRDAEATKLVAVLREHHRLSEILIRNRKSVVGGFMPRHAARWEVQLSDVEREVHELMEGVMQRGFAHAASLRGSEKTVVGFQMVILQKLLASSSRALLASLLRRRQKDDEVQSIADEARAELLLQDDQAASDVLAGLSGGWSAREEFDDMIAALKGIRRDTKTEVLRNGLKTIFRDPEEAPNPKVLIFTEFRETQDMLTEQLADLAEIEVFHGQKSPAEKDAAVERFRTGRGPQLLISTEAGGEGRNFQFCHIVVNYDLPWNPMKVEQRIGRVDRIRQEHPVSVFNFHVTGTIEGRILDVLERRINIFEQAVGSLDPILGEAEADIRKALRLAREKRDEMLDQLGERLEHQIHEAREAEKQLADLILESKSYATAIEQRVRRESAPVSPEEFERLLLTLLRSVNTYIGELGPDGERSIHFHPPFTLQHPELVQNEEARRILFDPERPTDSELVEYFGFGHPIVDRLVHDAIHERHGSAAAVRRIEPDAVDVHTPGWQFNWRISVGGLKPTSFIYPIFVDDHAVTDLEAGERLHRRSRVFPPEESADVPDSATLDDALSAAEKVAAMRMEELLEAARAAAEESSAIAEERLRALFDSKRQAATDRIEACRRTLDKLRASSSAGELRVIPVWEANLRRAEAEVENLDSDQQRQLRDLKQQGHPDGEFELLNLARIEPVAETAVA
jgi:superfamily II DNA or RNA helicase